MLGYVRLVVLDGVEHLGRHAVRKLTMRSRSYEITLIFQGIYFLGETKEFSGTTADVVGNFRHADAIVLAAVHKESEHYCLHRSEFEPTGSIADMLVASVEEFRAEVGVFGEFYDELECLQDGFWSRREGVLLLDATVF